MGWAGEERTGHSSAVKKGSGLLLVELKHWACG